MLRALSICVAAAAALTLSTAATLAQSTTRIETRPFYGATVTLESGVRVFRPLPPERQVIINPEGKTPLSLGFNETNIYERRVIKSYNYTDSGRASAPRDNAVGGIWGWGAPYGYNRGYGGYGNRGGHGRANPHGTGTVP